MKKVGYIYDKICDINNIKRAIIESSKGKRGRKDVEYVLSNINKKAIEIQQILLNESYIPSEYNVFSIREGSNNKERIIHSPKFFPDQIIHKILIQQIEDIIMKGMYYFSCASIKNRGIHYGAKYLTRWLKEDPIYTKYCFKLDITKFFPSVNKEKLKELFTYKIKDEKTLNLINTIIDSVEKGIPIGNYTSQWFANFYLQKLDHYIKEQLGVKYYMRYMDDMIILGNNKKKLHKIKNYIENFLSDYSLLIKNNWQIFKVDDRGIDFLGFRFFHYKIILRKQLMLRIARKAMKTCKVKSIKNLSAVISYYGWIYYSDSYNFKNNYIDPYININECKKMISNHNKELKSTL